VEYQWWNGVRMEGATGAELCLDANDPYYPSYDERGGKSKEYLCEITAYEKDDYGIEISSRKLWAERVYVTTEKTSKGKLYSIFLEPFEIALGGTVMALGFSYGMLLPVSPLVFLGFLIYGFFQGIIGLF
jgi:hypothetical protein